MSFKALLGDLKHYCFALFDFGKQLLRGWLESARRVLLKDAQARWDIAVERAVEEPVL